MHNKFHFMMPTIILFDFGGVLVDLDKQRCLEAFAALGFDASPYLGAFGQKGVFEGVETGQTTLDDFCQAIRQLGIQPEATDEDILKAWGAFLVGVPANRLELLLRIKQHYRTAVLSNTNEVHWGLAKDDYFRYQGRHVDDFFQDIFLSYELGVCKPDVRIFEQVIERLGVPPADILFLDDSERNCEVARQCGMQARIAPAGGEWMSYFDEEGRYILP